MKTQFVLLLEIFSKALVRLSFSDKISLARLVLPNRIVSDFSLVNLFLTFSISARSLNFSSLSVEISSS